MSDQDNSTTVTRDVDDFFDNTGGGSGAPSAKLSNIDDFVIGEIVDQYKVEKKKFASDEVEKDSKTGQPIKQLVVILQTDLRNWQGVAKVPYKDLNDKSQGTKDPSEDDGKRALYVAPWTNLHAAVGEAIVKATGKKQGLKTGNKLGVKIVDLEDTGKGNPKKVHAATYVVAEASDGGFFDSGQSSAPASSPAPAQEPAQNAAPQSPSNGDPWGVNTSPDSNKPPF